MPADSTASVTATQALEGGGERAGEEGGGGGGEKRRGGGGRGGGGGGGDCGCALVRIWESVIIDEVRGWRRRRKQHSCISNAVRSPSVSEEGRMSGAKETLGSITSTSHSDWPLLITASIWGGISPSHPHHLTIPITASHPHMVVMGHDENAPLVN